MAFEILPDGKKAPICHWFVQCNVIFDIKNEDFRHKTRLLVGGQMTKAPATIRYASVVSKETVRIVMMIAAPSDLEVKSGDIINV